MRPGFEGTVIKSTRVFYSRSLLTNLRLVLFLIEIAAFFLKIQVRIVPISDAVVISFPYDENATAIILFLEKIKMFLEVSKI